MKNEWKKWIIIFLACLLVGVFLVSVVASPNDPSRFGNLTVTTCWVGGSAGIVNCTGNAIFDGTVTATNFYGTFTGNSSIWSRAGTNTFLTNVGDRVGIGISSPDSAFHIKASVSGYFGQIIIQNPADDVTSNAAITAYESDGSGNPDQQLWYLGSSSSGNEDIIFWNRGDAKLTLGTNDTSRITILGNGNVGIGTATPATALDVVGTITTDSHDTSAEWKTAYDNYAADQYLFNTGDTASGVYTFSGRVDMVSGTPKIRFSDTGGTANKRVMDIVLTTDALEVESRNDALGWVRTPFVIEHDGNVGIGTTSPAELLTIVGANATIKLDRVGGASNKAVVKFTTNVNVNDWEIGTRDNTQDLHIYNNNLGATQLFLDRSDARVGIGTTSPSYKLEVVGTGKFDDNLLIDNEFARLRLGNQAGTGDVHFGSSGAGAPLNGTQDYGFYAAYNAYRAADGYWYHSRTTSVNAYKFNAGHHNAGFSWNYAANQGSSNITWTELMKLTSGGNLGIGTSSPDNTLHISKGTNAINTGIFKIENTAGTSVGTGASIEFYSKENTPAQVEMARIGTELTSGAAGSSSSDLVFDVMSAGSLSEVMRFKSGNVFLGADIYVGGNDIFSGEQGTDDKRAYFKLEVKELETNCEWRVVQEDCISSVSADYPTCDTDDVKGETSSVGPLVTCGNYEVEIQCEGAVEFRGYRSCADLKII